MNLQSNGEIEVFGLISMDATFNGIRLFDEYFLKIVIPPDYPGELPKVYSDVNSFPLGFEHYYHDGELCLGVENDILDRFEDNPELLFFVESIVISYFYSASYFKRYGDYPYGDRSHGVLGVLEYYFERFKIDNINALFGLLESITQKKYRGHINCPCGSGIIGRKCHGTEIIKAINSNRLNLYINDLSTINEILEKVRSEHAR